MCSECPLFVTSAPFHRPRRELVYRRRRGQERAALLYVGCGAHRQPELARLSGRGVVVFGALFLVGHSVGVPLGSLPQNAGPADPLVFHPQQLYDRTLSLWNGRHDFDARST